MSLSLNIFNSIWIPLIIFLIITIIRTIRINNILTYLMKNYKEIYEKYNPNNSSIFMLQTTYKLTPLIKDVFTNKLLLDDNLKKMIKIHRSIIIIHITCMFILTYLFINIAI